MVTKLKNSNCNKTNKKNYCDKTKNLIMGGKKIELWQNLSGDKTQIVTKLKLGQNSKLWQKSNCDKSQIVKKN